MNAITRGLLVAALGLHVAAAAKPASAQILADGPVVYGHHHLNVTSVEATKKFLVDALGGSAIRIGESRAEVVRFPNVLIFMRAQAPKGGSKGTSVDHIGFAVPDLRKAVDQIKAAGFPIITNTETGAPRVVKGDIAFPPAGQDDLKVELVEMLQQATPITLHHVHFLGQQNNEMHAWYVKTFGAEARPATNFPTAVLPGVSLLFSASPAPALGTQGRALNHIGFEVRDLEAFLAKLTAGGIKLDIAYRKVPALNAAVAFFTDPWGTYIELTEGLGRVAIATD